MRNACCASRASWCGQLKLGTLCVPVKAYAAIATPPEIPLRQLHALCGARIEYRKCCPTHGEVPAEEIIKGYPYQPEQYVRLTEEELAGLQPADEKTLHLEHFLDAALLDITLLSGRSLYLAPANPAARKPFATIHHSLERSGKWAIGRVVFSGKWQIVAVRPAERGSCWSTRSTILLSAGPWSIPKAARCEVSQQELRLLMRLIDTTDGEIPWEDYQDDTERRLTELVETKVAAPKTRVPDGPMAGTVRATDDPTAMPIPRLRTMLLTRRRKAA